MTPASPTVSGWGPRTSSDPPPLAGPAALEIHETLGEGGFGIVRRATQTSVGREVAVKTLRAEHNNPRAHAKLLEEGRTTGRLEHPNVIPVYDVRKDDAGAPVVVLKRIDGVVWRELLLEPHLVRDRFGAEDLLDWNLRILLQVCNALRFAHSRGVIHRDIKPDNVMIGEFGEVYLLDWGIAIGYRDDAAGFPKESATVAGTPAYMAPEQCRRGNGAPSLTPQTDVYLLGSVLYELIRGRPPHVRQSRRDLRKRVPRPLSADTPEQLRAIIDRAMAPEPAQRYPSVEAFQAAIEHFLACRSVAAVVDAADRALVELASTDGTSRSARHRAHRAFHECRFGYRVALDTWPDHPSAKRGLERAIELMVEHELACGRPEAAALYLEDLPRTRRDLAERVEKAIAKEANDAVRVERLVRIGEAADPDVGERTRLRFGVLLGTVWTLVSFLGAVGNLFGLPVLPTSSVEAIVWPVLFIFVLGIGSLATWRELGTTAFNKQLVFGVAFLFFVQIAGTLGAGVMGIDFPTIEVFYPLLWWSVASFVAMVFERRLLPGASGYFLGFVGAVAMPEQRLWWIFGANLGMLLNLAILSRRYGGGWRGRETPLAVVPAPRRGPINQRRRSG